MKEIEAAIERLPEGARDVLVLYAICGVNCTPCEAAPQVFRARRRPMAAAALALLILFVGAKAAHAQTRSTFDDADANHDGHVTLQEADIRRDEPPGSVHTLA